MMVDGWAKVSYKIKRKKIIIIKIGSRRSY